MWTKEQESIYQEYLASYRSKFTKIKPADLRELIKLSAINAQINYCKLADPKTCSLKTYITHWIREEVIHSFVSKTLVKLPSVKNQPESFEETLADYFNFVSSNFVANFKKKLFSVALHKRNTKWKELRLSFIKFEQCTQNAVRARNEFARNQGFSSYIDLVLDSNKITNSDFSQFKETVDDIIDYCNNSLLLFNNYQSAIFNEFEDYCFICNSQSFPFLNLQEVLNYFVNNFPEIRKFKTKIKIVLGSLTKMEYQKDRDMFNISLNEKLNTRHQILGFIHELGHVVSYLKNFANEIDLLEHGRYFAEKEALQVEYDILFNNAEFQSQAYLGDLLKLYHRVLFELELYKNPNQDLSKLYAQTFNHCYKQANQKSNPLFIFDEYITLKPLSSLPYSIAYTNIFQKSVSI